MKMPYGAERAVKLSSVEGVEIGARISIACTYKGLNITLRLVRVEGGWEVEQKRR